MRRVVSYECHGSGVVDYAGLETRSVTYTVPGSTVTITYEGDEDFLLPAIRRVQRANRHLFSTQGSKEVA